MIVDTPGLFETLALRMADRVRKALLDRAAESVQSVHSSDGAQTSFDVSRDLPSPGLFSGALPDPPVKKPVRKASKKVMRRENVLSFADEYKRKHGHVPAFSTLKGRFHLSKATAHRYRQEALKRESRVKLS